MDSGSDRPNILILMSDQHQAKYLGCDMAGLETPNLDALARQSAVFDAAYCPSPLCVPSRMSFMATRYPHEVGVFGNSGMLDSSVPTFAHAVGAAGYETALVGRMHFRGADPLHGFHRRLVGDLSPQYSFQRLDLGPFSGNAGAHAKALMNAGAGITALDYFDDAVAEAAIGALADWRARRARDARTKPFMHVVGLYRPHSPFRAPRRSFDLYAGKVRLPERPPPGECPDYVRHYREISELDGASPEDELRALAAYHALVTDTDRRVGRILDALAEGGLAERTLVMYTSDHGDHAGAHQLWWKQSFYEESARIPLLLWAPGIGEARRVATPVSLLDVAATAIEATGGKPLAGTRAGSLMPLARGGAVREAGPVFSELGASRMTVPSRMVREGRWKYIHYHGGRFGAELYDLDSDPRELRNRVADPSCAPVRDRLHALLFADGWDPERVLLRCQREVEEAEAMKKWCETTRPKEPCFFMDRLRPDVNQAQ